MHGVSAAFQSALRLKLTWFSMTIDTACSGSLVSLDVACRYLQTREVNGAIIAGANLYLKCVVRILVADVILTFPAVLNTTWMVSLTRASPHSGMPRKAVG